MKQITLNVDDLGLAPAVNQAVLRLAEMGRIQSASFMSLGRIDADEVAQLRQYAVEIGLHLDFTGLAKQGSLKQVMWRSWRRGRGPGTASSRHNLRREKLEGLINLALQEGLAHSPWPGKTA